MKPKTLHMIALTVVYFAALTGCGGSGGGSSGGGRGGTGPSASTMCSTTGSYLANQIRLDCGVVSGDTVTAHAVIGGLSTSTDIASVLFDLTFDEALYEFVAGSAVEGTFLSAGGPTFFSATLSGTDPGRVIVSIVLQSGAPGVQAPANETLILSFDFRSLGGQGGSMLSFSNAEALESGGMAAPGILFSDNLMLTTL